MWDLKAFHIYTLCSHEKNHVFSMWDLKPISIYTLCSQEKNHVFSMWDKKPFGLILQHKRIIYYLFNVGFETH